MYCLFNVKSAYHVTFYLDFFLHRLNGPAIRFLPEIFLLPKCSSSCTKRPKTKYPQSKHPRNIKHSQPTKQTFSQHKHLEIETGSPSGRPLNCWWEFRDLSLTVGVPSDYYLEKNYLTFQTIFQTA